MDGGEVGNARVDAPGDSRWLSAQSPNKSDAIGAAASGDGCSDCRDFVLIITRGKEEIAEFGITKGSGKGSDITDKNKDKCGKFGRWRRRRK